jgi:hypothetical protein
MADRLDLGVGAVGTMWAARPSPRGRVAPRGEAGDQPPDRTSMGDEAAK